MYHLQLGLEMTPLYKDRTAPIEKRVDDLMSRMTLHEKVLQLQNRASGRLDEIDRIFLGKVMGQLMK